MSARRRDGGEVGRAAVADGDGRVAAAALLHEHVGERLADDVAAADDDHVAAGDLDVVAHQQLLHAVGSAGEESRPALHEAADVFGVEDVDVFGGRDGEHDAGRVDVIGIR